MRERSNSEMSAPETKASSPAPRITTTRTDASSSSSATAPGIACHISAEMALRRSAWSKTSQARAPSRSMRTVPDMDEKLSG